MTPAENLARARGWVIHFLVPVNGWEWAHPELVRGVTDACAAALAAAVREKGEAGAARVDRWLVAKGNPHPIAVDLRAHAADIPEVPHD